MRILVTCREADLIILVPVSISIINSGYSDSLVSVPVIFCEGQGGRVINISSINAWNAIRFLQGRHYETAKAAIVQFTRSLAIDWAPHGITVNAICPGLFMTEPNIKWSADNPEEIKSLIDRIPGRETGKPEDLGPLAVYLASDASSYINGASIVIDGGFTC